MMTKPRGPNERWEQGLPHHPKSEKIFESIAKLDLELNDDHFCWKSGGDGDNGESLMYLLDEHFEQADAVQSNMPTKTLTELAQIGYEAYGAEADWKAYNGEPMPKWDELPDHIHRKWKAAVGAVASELGAEPPAS